MCNDNDEDVEIAAARLTTDMASRTEINLERMVSLLERLLPASGEAFSLKVMDFLLHLNNSNIACLKEGAGLEKRISDHIEKARVEIYYAGKRIGELTKWMTLLNKHQNAIREHMALYLPTLAAVERKQALKEDEIRLLCKHFGIRCSNDQLVRAKELMQSVLAANKLSDDPDMTDETDPVT